MQPFQARVIAEKRDLDDKIEKLQKFREGGTYLSLPPDERELLTRQFITMSEYSQILKERIKAFGFLDVTVTINGKITPLKSTTLTYAELVALAGYPLYAQPSATYGYIGEQNRGGILSRGQSLEIVGNEYFTVVETGNA